MAIIKAFKGLRPPVEIAEKLSALPYDVMDSDEARVMAEGNPYSFLHVTKPEIDLEPGINLYDDCVYEKAASNLNEFIKKGYFVQDKKDCLYLYVQEMNGNVQKGLVVCSAVDDYENNIIKKHELTRKDKEDDRARHVNDTNCNAGPVFLTYRAEKDIDELVEKFIAENKPVYDFTSSDSGIKVRNTFYVIDSDDIISMLIEHFKRVPVTYVADGHHRAASGFRTRQIRAKNNPAHTGQEEYNFFLSVLFPHNQLKIMDYNRAVKDLNGKDSASFIDEISKRFSVSKINADEYSPIKTKNIGMYIDGQWYNLQPLHGTYDEQSPVDSLDVAILQNNILEPALGIKDPRTDSRISFIGGIRGVKELVKLVDSGKYAVAFAMYPTLVEELMSIADDGSIMPPKSTWFEPKLRSGLVIHML